jgi:hypothetical protein
MSNNDTISINEAILLNLAQVNHDVPFKTIAEYNEAVSSPMYQSSEAYRQAVDARLELSQHLLKNTPHTVSDFRGSDAVAAHFKTDRNGDAVMTAIGSPNDIGRGDSVQTKEADLSHEPEFINTGSSVIMNFSTERSFDEGNEGE